MNERIFAKSLGEYSDPDEEIAITRELAIDGIAAMGGPVFGDRATNEQIAATFRRLTRQLPNSVAEINVELAKPASDRRRARLMMKKYELEATPDAAKPKPAGDLVVIAPEGFSNLEFASGRAVSCEMIDGRRAFRLSGAEFKILAAHDSRWLSLNPALANRLG